MGCCCSKPVDEPLAGTPSKGKKQGETPQKMRPKEETQGGALPRPVDVTLAETPPKGETQGGAPPRSVDVTFAETPPQPPPKRKRARDTAILLLSFASIASEASDLLKPMKAVSEFIKKILEVTKVSFNLPDEAPLFTKSQRAWRR